MWTNRAHFLVFSIRINRFRLPISMPLFIVNSLVSELGDLVCFFTFFSKRIQGYVELVETTVQSLYEFKKYDFVDIDIKSKNKNKRVKIKICTR